jgi:uncharacterized protein YodC (DUF2158 family)
MALYTRIVEKLLGPKSRFRCGDYVQTCKGGALLIVQWIKVNRKTRTITLSCKWFDNDAKSTRTNIFTEDQLTPFDWNTP